MTRHAHPLDPQTSITTIYYDYRGSSEVRAGRADAQEAVYAKLDTNDRRTGAGTSDCLSEVHMGLYEYHVLIHAQYGPIRAHKHCASQAGTQLQPGTHRAERGYVARTTLNQV